MFTKAWDWIKGHPWTTAIITTGAIIIVTLIVSPKVRGWVFGKTRKLLPKKKTAKQLAGYKKSAKMKA